MTDNPTTPNPWGIRAVPSCKSLLRLVERDRAKRPWVRWLEPDVTDAMVVRRMRKSLLAVRRGDTSPLSALQDLNYELAGYNVEGLTLRSGAVVHYVNLGESYATTLLLVERGGRMRFQVGAWGDLVERWG